MRARRRRTGETTAVPHIVRGMLAVVALLATTGLSSGCGVFPQNAYCAANDPVVTPTSVGPGDEVDVRIDGVGGLDCSTELPDHARYEISIMSLVDGTGNDDAGSHYYSADLVVVDPDEDGAARTTVVVPEDMPPGPARISVDLENAKTLCEIDPSMSCPMNPSASIEITP